MTDTKLKTLDDWWNKGFDDYFKHIAGEKIDQPPTEMQANTAWYSGYSDASDYRTAIGKATR